MENFKYDIYYYPMHTNWDHPIYKDIETFAEAEKLAMELKIVDICIIERLGNKVNHTYTISKFIWDEKNGLYLDKDNKIEDGLLEL